MSDRTLDAQRRSAQPLLSRTGRAVATPAAGRPARPSLLLRVALGQVLRARRQAQRRTLRDVASAAQMSLGYLSEVERGAKEPSSELLAALCTALGLPLQALLKLVGDRLDCYEHGGDDEQCLGAVAPVEPPEAVSSSTTGGAPHVSREGRTLTRLRAPVGRSKAHGRTRP